MEPLPDGSGHFFNLSNPLYYCIKSLIGKTLQTSYSLAVKNGRLGVQNKLMNIDENIYIPINKAELAVLVSALKVTALILILLLYILGLSFSISKSTFAHNYDEVLSSSVYTSPPSGLECLCKFNQGGGFPSWQQC